MIPSHSYHNEICSELWCCIWDQINDLLLLSLHLFYHKIKWLNCFVEWMTGYQRAVRMSARQPWKVAAEIMSFMKLFYILKRRKHFWWNNLVLVLRHIMKWWCNTVGYKSLTMSIYRGQLYDVTHWIKSYTNSPAILILYHSFSFNLWRQDYHSFLNWTWNIFDVNHHFVNSSNIFIIYC